MDTIKNAAAQLGKLGGKSTSELKRAAARTNGKLGGRPKIEWTSGGITEGRCRVCDNAENGRSGEHSFLVSKRGVHRQYMCESCGTVYTRKPPRFS